MLETRHASENDTYGQLRSRAVAALVCGEVDRAEKLFEWAHTEARRSRDPVLVERAFCNRCMVANVRCEATRFIPDLRKIVSESDDPEARYLAAYNLANAFGEERLNRKARFYAEIALQEAGRLESRHLAAGASYALGLLWLGDSRLQRAQRWIEKSMELLECEAESPTLALEGSSLGYCLTLMRQPRRALNLLENGVDTISRSRSRLYESYARLNFGFALLEMGEAEGAGAQAHQVLESGCQHHERKYSLYLAGEALACLDRLRPAREAFRILQEEFFPGIPDLADELLTHRTHGVISWLA